MKRTMLRDFRCFALVLSLAVAGCASTSHIITGTPRDPVDPAQVTLYTSAPPEYEEIAIVQASSSGSFVFGDQAKMDVVVQRLKEEAAALGANGVLLQDTQSQGGGGGVGTGFGVSSGGGSYVSTGIYTSSSVRTGRGLAIYVPIESSR